MTILDRSRDAYATQPMDAPADAYTVPAPPVSGPLSPSGPLSRSGSHRAHSGPIDRTNATWQPPTDPDGAELGVNGHKPYQGIPTRILFPAAEAWSRAKRDLQPRARRKFEMFCLLTHPSGVQDRITCAGIVTARGDTCMVLFCEDVIYYSNDPKLGMATLWKHLRATWPAATETLWQFTEFPRWHGDKWCAALNALQAAAIKRTGGLR